MEQTKLKGENELERRKNEILNKQNEIEKRRKIQEKIKDEKIKEKN